MKQRESVKGEHGVSQAAFDEEEMERRFGEALRQAATIIRAQDVALREVCHFVDAYLFKSALRSSTSAIRAT